MSIPNVPTDPTDSNHASAQFTPGSLFYWSKVSSGVSAEPVLVKYVKFLDAVTYIVGQVVEWASATAASVTNDRSGGSAIGTQTAPAGIVLDVMTQNYFGFIQVSGNALVIGDGSVAAGEAVVSHSVDGEADTMAAGEEHQVFGVALDADGTGNDPLGVSTMFHCRLKGLV